jgi:hypothetical protein
VMGSKQTEGILAVGNSFSVAPTWKEYAWWRPEDRICRRETELCQNKPKDGEVASNNG